MGHLPGVKINKSLSHLDKFYYITGPLSTAVFYALGSTRYIKFGISEGSHPNPFISIADIDLDVKLYLGKYDKSTNYEFLKS